MTLKQIFKLIIVVLLIGSIGSTIYLLDKNKKQTDNIEYLRHNLSVKDTKISEITFTTKELKEYISTKDTKHKNEIDSILKLHKVKIKDLSFYSKIQNRIIDVDTTKVTSNESKIQNDSIYLKEIQYSKNCLKIDGYLLTKDSTTEAFITKVDSDNKIYITKSYKKSFWDYIFFKKGKEIIQTTSECGESTIDNINIKE